MAHKQFNGKTIKPYSDKDILNLVLNHGFNFIEICNIVNINIHKFKQLTNGFRQRKSK